MLRFARVSLSLGPIVRVVLVAIYGLTACVVMAADVIPHAQDKPPGPPLSPAEAIKKMVVPEGFAVELVAAEPDIVNPVAMTFDERGRIWITESLEYPRRDAGPGKDRVKILEDTDGDGKADKFTVFAEGLNIPSGIAVGHGGVWVANSPDILFMQDSNGDDRADRREVVVTGFGRDDTHELPNSLTWGPDGCLYGLNGVFNQSHITQGDRQFDFTCALFRIDPRTRKFDLFAEGTSNPWGVAWNGEGSAFLSACVIDHLWHLTETGYYFRQGGPYPPFTSVIGSIVKHKHQKAAYCGIHWFDSDAYPKEYRERLYMGNIHGNCINVDSLSRDGSTYVGEAAPDFLTANDAWFMPVAQKTGPDGCLYILDWYDRYHCYQDANRDPAGIDRLKGRLYRVRYKDAPRAPRFDLAKETDDQLLERLKSPNVFFRDLAQRLLVERNQPETRKRLERMVLDNSLERKARMHALWSLVGGGPLAEKFHQKLLAHADAGFRAWGVRAAGNAHQVDRAIRDKVVAMARDPVADVRLQVAIAARKLDGVDAIPVLLSVLSSSDDDQLIPHIVWQNLHPLLEEHSEDLLKLLASGDLGKSPAVAGLMPRVVERILGRNNSDSAPIVSLIALLTSGPAADAGTAQKCLAQLATKIQTREIAGERLAALKPKLEGVIAKILSGTADGPLYLDAALLATTWKDSRGIEAARNVYLSDGVAIERRLQALDALIAAGDSMVDNATGRVLNNSANPIDLRAATLGSLGRLSQRSVARVVLNAYAKMEPELQPKAIELLTQRREWAIDLLDAIDRKEIPAAALNLNQVRKLLDSKDPTLVEKVTAQWGSVRADRNPEREKVIAQMRTHLRRTPGNADKGQAVFQKVCGQCHKIYGEGQDVGPDITLNGRNSFEQLLSNVLDPSLVIGAAYHARTVVTTDGRILNGLLAEDGQQRIVLKTQGGKLETIARNDVDEIKISPLSLMPEELEKQLKPEELADLFAFLTLDKPPSDPTARRLPGTAEIPPQDTTEPARFGEILSQFAPGFSTQVVGERGLGILADHFGRSSVLRTHPLDRETPCVLHASIDVPAEKQTRLMLSVSHDEKGDWQLIVKADGKTLHDAIIGENTTRDHWSEIAIDLSQFAGKKIELELLNQANDWLYEFAYWGRIEVVSQ